MSGQTAARLIKLTSQWQLQWQAVSGYSADDAAPRLTWVWIWQAAHSDIMHQKLFFLIFTEHHSDSEGGWYFLAAAAAAATAGQVNRKRKTRAGARQAVRMYPERLRTRVEGRVSCSTLDPNEFTFLREIPCKALSPEDRSQSCLHMPSNSFKRQQTRTQSAIEGEQAGWSLRGERIRPSVFLLHLMLLDRR